MSRNLLLFLMLFLFTLTAGVVEVSGKINVAKEISRIKSIALASTHHKLKNDYK